MSPTLTLAPPVVNRRQATLAVREGADVLVRVLVTLRRRGCTVISVDYNTGDRHREGWLTVAYAPPPRHGHAVRGWLANLVDVLDVEDAAV
jgi:acetolactate synthase regulatory subunit